MNRRLIALLLVSILLLPGCLNSTENESSDDVPGDTTIIDDRYSWGDPPTLVEVPNTAGCDNLNPIHCMLPFPSDAFLVEDSTTVTGLRVNYAESTLPESDFLSSQGEVAKIESLNLNDGMSPSTQIMTAFTTVPNLNPVHVATQHTIALSLRDESPTVLMNLDTGEKVAHWVEIDARADDDNATILFIRTLEQLEPNTPYGVGIANFGDARFGGMDWEVEPSLALQSILSGPYASHVSCDGCGLLPPTVTDAPDVENRRNSTLDLLRTFARNNWGMETGDGSWWQDNVKAAWQFHTASLDSIIGPTLSMRADALDRLGDGGIGCTVENVDDDWIDDTEADFRRITGTYTVPQYLEWQNPPSKISTDANGTPQFVEYAEIPFTLVIPKILADNNESGPLVVWGHGFLGNGNGAISSAAIGWMQEYEVAMIGTAISGWSSSDLDTIFMGLANVSYFEHQSDRLQQMLVNQMALARTFKGVCSDITQLYNNGTNLVNSSDVHYMGYSLGGIYGASITAFSPDIDRAALWVGGSGFSTFIERSTNYATFSDGFKLPDHYPQRNDRALLIAVCQHMWDATDAETWLRFAESGYGDEIQPFNVLSTISINDAQVPGLSADRSARTAGMPLLNGSMRTPYGIDVADGPITGSAIVYWDGGYDAMPDTNAAPPIGDAGKAHNEIAPIIQVNSMVQDFLLTGIINDTCNGSCTFDYNTDQADWD